MLSRVPYNYIDIYKPGTTKSHCNASQVFATGTVENEEDCFPLDLSNVQI